MGRSARDRLRGMMTMTVTRARARARAIAREVVYVARVGGANHACTLLRSFTPS